MTDFGLLLQYLAWWALFGFIHTTLSSKSLKLRIGLGKTKYRIIYNIIATFTLLLVILNVPSIISILLSGLDLNMTRRILFFFMLTSGWVIGFFGLMAWNLSALAGFEEDKDPLKRDGIYAFCRHPVYIAAILILLSTLIIEINAVTLSWLVGAGGYFVVGTISEEKKMVISFEEYVQYKLDVGRFLPWKIRHLKYLIKNYRPQGDT